MVASLPGNLHIAAIDRISIISVRAALFSSGRYQGSPEGIGAVIRVGASAPAEYTSTVGIYNIGVATGIEYVPSVIYAMDLRCPDIRVSSGVTVSPDSFSFSISKSTQERASSYFDMGCRSICSKTS
jgi:hypothetical protein